MSTDLEAKNGAVDAGQSAAAGASTSGRRDARSFLKNSAMLSCMGLMVSGLGLVYRVYIARYFGDTGYGTYIFITTFVTYFGVISLFGFRNVIVRQVAAKRDRAGSYARAGLQLRLISGVIALAVATILALVLQRTEGVELLVIVCAISLPAIALSDMLDAVFLGLEKSEYSAISAAITNVLKVVIGIVLLVNGYGLLSILILFAGVSALNAVLNWLFLRYKLGIVLPSRQPDLPQMRRYVFHEALPFWYIMLISKIYYKNDILILGWLKGDQVVGWYGGAYMAVDVLLLVGGALANAMFPIISRAYASEPERVGRYFESLSKYVFLLFAPACLVVSMLGGDLIPAILGDSFRNGIDALQVVVWMILFETLSSVAGMVMAATGRQKIMAITGGGVTAITFPLTFLLVRSFSYMGAAWATTVGAIISFIVAQCVIKRILPGSRLAQVLSRPVLAAAVMLAVSMTLVGYGRPFAVVSGLVAYIGSLWVLKAVGTEDRLLISKAIKAVHAWR